MGATASPFHNTGVATVLYLPPDPGTYVKADCTQHAWSQPLCCRLDASRVIVPRVVAWFNNARFRVALGISARTLIGPALERVYATPG